MEIQFGRLVHVIILDGVAEIRSEINWAFRIPLRLIERKSQNVGRVHTP